jgi:heat shock protein HtpX
VPDFGTLERRNGKCARRPTPGRIASHLAHSRLSGTGGTLRAVKNTFKTFVLLAGLGGLLVIIGQVLFGYAGAIIGLAIGLVFVGFSYWRSDTLAIRAARAVPVTEQEMPEYYAIVRELTQQAGMPMPKLYVTPDQQPNAFATGRNPEHAAVAVTQGILRILTWDQLRGVLAHEISHVGNRDILIGSVAAAIAVGITFIANILQFTAIFGGGRDDEGGNPIALLALAILAPLAAGLLQMALSRSREFEADRSGARLIGDGEPLAQALEKLEAGARQIPMNIDPAHASAFIVNPLAGRKISFGNLWRTHPATEDRVERLRGGEWR